MATKPNSMEQADPGTTPTQPKKKSFFTRRKIRTYLANSIGYIMLTISALSSATGVFKAIPVLFATLIPVAPIILINIFCAITFIMALFAFYSTFSEDIFKYCQLLFKLILPSKEEIDPEDITIKKKDNELTELRGKKEIASSNRAQTETSIKEYKTILNDKNIDFEQCPEIENTNNTSIKATEDNDKSLKSRFKKFWRVFVQIIAILFAAIGCSSVVGMTIFTNQSSFIYFGIAISPIITIVCTVFAFIKQISQMTNNALKSHKNFCKVLGVDYDEKMSNTHASDLEKQKDDLKSQLDSEKIIDRRNNLKEKIKNIEIAILTQQIAEENKRNTVLEPHLQYLKNLDKEWLEKNNAKIKRLENIFKKEHFVKEAKNHVNRTVSFMLDYHTQAQSLLNELHTTTNVTIKAPSSINDEIQNYIDTTDSELENEKRELVYTNPTP